MLARCLSASLLGFDAIPVTVEVDLAPGLPGLQLVGLPDTAIQESRERVRAALRNSGFRGPLVRVVVNLAPADLRKEGPAFDLPIALALLVASGQLDAPVLNGLWCAGELGLDGSIRSCRGILAIACEAAKQQARALAVSVDDAAEASLVRGLVVHSAPTLRTLVERLRSHRPGALQPCNQPEQAAVPATTTASESADKLLHLPGQQLARKGLAIAAAGGHHLLLVGPPGCGKTVLAHHLPSLLPPLDREESLEITRLHSIAGHTRGRGKLIRQRPFRSPHHSATAAALLGGGRNPRPGELSLAHGGVLFLDELTEFPRAVLDQLRQPLEEGVIWLSRAKISCRFPSRVTLIAAANPCPCGWSGDQRCICSELQRRRYWGRLSGPLLDRLDLQLRLEAAEPSGLRPSPAEHSSSEDSSFNAASVHRARLRMRQRNPHGVANRELSAEKLQLHGRFRTETLSRWEDVLRVRRLSLRSGMGLLRIARTVADLQASDQVSVEDLASALRFRSFDVAEPWS